MTNGKRTDEDAPIGERRIAIACQGGGSHTAFTAGVLKQLLRTLPANCVSALSGTSGGAICALLARQGWAARDPQRGINALDAFWRDNEADSPGDRWINDSLVATYRFSNFVSTPVFNPYFYPNWGQAQLAALLKQHIDFEQLAALPANAPGAPDALISAINVLSGDFVTFRNAEIDLNALLATTALPELLRAVRRKHGGQQGLYWDGLYAQNPPVRDFLNGKLTCDDKPDEIWIIQIDPQTRDSEPIALRDIQDRRNELAGNLSLNQEVYFIQKVNDFVRRGFLPAERFKQVTVRRIALARQLDYASKLDRSPQLVRSLMQEGEASARRFLSELSSEMTVRVRPLREEAV